MSDLKTPLRYDPYESCIYDAGGRVVFDSMTDIAETYDLIRRCNAFDGLLAACKLAKQRLDQMGMDWIGNSPDPLEAAIAAAEKTK